MMRAHEAMARLILIQTLMDYSGIPMRKGKDSPTVVAKKLLFLSGYTVKATVTGSNVPCGIGYMVEQSWVSAPG